MLRLAAPEWLVLAPLLIAAGWRWPTLGFARPLRATLLVLLLLILVRPEWPRFGRGLDLWVLVDRSDSAAETLGPRLREWETLLERARGGEDRLCWLDYAEDATVRDEANNITYAAGTKRTRTRLAIETALALRRPGRAARLLVLTDGYSTEPLAPLAERLRREGVALDYRLAEAPNAGRDPRIEELQLPPRVQAGEPFLVQLRVAGPDPNLRYEILRDGARVMTATAALRGGRQTIRFTDRVTAGGSHHYVARILPDADPILGNNTADGWVEIAGGPRVLLLTSSTDDPLAGVLRGQGWEVEMVTEFSRLHVGRLTGVKAVILNNVPAYQLPAEFLAALPFQIEKAGAGLLMAGGKFSFGSGGYFEGPLDPLLPVSMELRQEHRKLAISLAIALDRSGSMGALTPGGVVKMDLADEGAARALELLGGADSVAVLAVDTEPHVIVPLTPVKGQVNHLSGEVRRVTSGGGGIYVGKALEGAFAELEKSTSGQRHVILFADAADAEEPANYASLIDEAVKKGTTVSVIGMGNETDSDAALLRDVAARGKGRIFFNADAAQLPALFAQETVAVARSTFLEEPVAVKPTAGWMEIAARPLADLPSVDGYNLGYLKPEATAAAFANDEYAAPLIAFWQRGAGRTAAVAFPLGGAFSQRVRAWAGYGDFAQTLTRWLMGEATPPGLGLKVRVDGEELALDLFYDAEWDQRFAEKPPRIFAARPSSPDALEPTWERQEPGHFRARLPLPAGEWVRGVVQAGSSSLPFGPVIAGVDPEWNWDRERLDELRELSRASGGVERLDFGRIWQAPRQREFRDATRLFCWLLLGLLLVEALVTRLGWNHLPPQFARWPGKFALPKIAPAKVRSVPSTGPKAAAQPEPPTVGKPAPPAPDQDRRARFLRAKNRRP